MIDDFKVTQNISDDCCVIGGGVVGASIALGLAKQGYKTTIIERHKPTPFKPGQAPDMRISAINMHAVNLFKDLRVWQHLSDMRYRAYSRLSAWEGESFLASLPHAKTTFHASELERAELGYFVENRLLQLALYKELKSTYNDKVKFVFETNISNINIEHGSVEMSDGKGVNSHLILGCDGGDSKLRNTAGIACSGWQYSQYASGILIETKERVADETWQVFYAEGPRALLPMHENYAMLVWYADKRQRDWIQNASDVQLHKAIVSAFPNLQSEFTVVNKASFPLSRMHAKRYGAKKCIILGDAAHTINPLAGQGLNLGLKDVSVLLSLVAKHGIENPQKLCRSFEAARYQQNLLMMSSMDVIYKSFSNNILPLKLLRSIFLNAADRSALLKKHVLQYAMGIDGAS